MKSIAPSTPHGYTIFCDDIRQEMGGKVSLMGIYKGKLIVDKPPPVALPKFVFVVHYFERPDESTEPVTLHIYLPGDAEGAPTVISELPVDTVRAQIPERVSSDSDPIFMLVSHLMAVPFNLKSEGLIQVLAYRGDLEMRLGTLSVVTRLEEDHTLEEVSPAANEPKPKKPASRKRRRSKKPS